MDSTFWMLVKVIEWRSIIFLDNCTALLSAVVWMKIDHQDLHPLCQWIIYDKTKNGWSKSLFDGSGGRVKGEAGILDFTFGKGMWFMSDLFGF